VTWNVAVSDNAVDFLAAGQSITETYVVEVDENHGGKTTQTVLGINNGANEIPVITAHTDGSVTKDVNVVAGNLTSSGTVSFTDVNLTDTHTAHATFVSSTNAGGVQLGTLTAAPPGHNRHTHPRPRRPPTSPPSP